MPLKNLHSGRTTEYKEKKLFKLLKDMPPPIVKILSNNFNLLFYKLSTLLKMSPEIPKI